MLHRLKGRLPDQKGNQKRYQPLPGGGGLIAGGNGTLAMEVNLYQY
jgi:hypothetical protein